MRKLSQNFTIEELIYSDTANRLGIKNIPNTTQLRNLGCLCQNVLQPLRDKLGKPILVTSGFRNEELNRKIGGTPNSQHTRGQAADIIAYGLSDKELYDFIKNSGIVYDQLILEQTKSGTWVHISYCSKLNRQQNLLYKNNRYTLDLN